MISSVVFPNKRVVQISPSTDKSETIVKLACLFLLGIQYLNPKYDERFFHSLLNCVRIFQKLPRIDLAHVKSFAKRHESLLDFECRFANIDRNVEGQGP